MSCPSSRRTSLPFVLGEPTPTPCYLRRLPPRVTSVSGRCRVSPNLSLLPSAETHTCLTSPSSFTPTRGTSRTGSVSGESLSRHVREGGTPSRTGARRYCPGRVGVRRSVFAPGMHRPFRNSGTTCHPSRSSEESPVGVGGEDTTSVEVSSVRPQV